MGPRAGLDWWKISPPPGFDPPDCPARSQLLYRLSYPAHVLYRYFHGNLTLWFVGRGCRPPSIDINTVAVKDINWIKEFQL